MSCAKIPFASMSWEPGAHPLEQKKVGAGASLLVFEPGFSDPNWCENGHVGLILEGALAFELDDATVEVAEGEAFAIDPGTRHRAFNPRPQRTLLFIAPRS